MLTDRGYTGAGTRVYIPVKGRDLDAGTRRYNELLTTLRALGECANAMLEERWRYLPRICLCPTRIGAIVAAAIVSSTLQSGNY
jgi:hypothetical protein